MSAAAVMEDEERTEKPTEWWVPDFRRGLEDVLVDRITADMAYSWGNRAEQLETRLHTVHYREMFADEPQPTWNEILEIAQALEQLAREMRATVRYRRDELPEQLRTADQQRRWGMLVRCEPRRPPVLSGGPGDVYE